MSKNYCKLTILLVALALTVLAGISTVAYAQSNSTQLQDERGIFDPFTLNVVMVSADNSTGAVLATAITRPSIRIPVRPVLRSYFRPPLVSLVP